MKRVEKNFRRNDRIGKLTGARGAWKACNTLSVHLLLRPQHGSSARLTDLDQTCVNYEKGDGKKLDESKRFKEEERENPRRE